jgi:hypothetical protein
LKGYISNEQMCQDVDGMVRSDESLDVVKVMLWFD